MDPGTLRSLEPDNDDIDLSTRGFTFLFSRVPLENYYQCGFGGMQYTTACNTLF